MAAHPEVAAARAADDARKRNAREEREEREARKWRGCLICERVFYSTTNTKTCSDKCWIERHRLIRERPCVGLTREKRLEAKRAQQGERNAKLRAALFVVEELKTKGLEALL